MELPHVYMIRSGDFGSDFTLKLVLSLLAVALAAYDRFRHRRWDYVWVLLVGTVTWTAVELVLQAKGIRVMRPGSLFGAPLPQAAKTLLQGMCEGAFVAVGGVFCGDRLLVRRTRTPALLGFALFTAAIVTWTLIRATGGPAAEAVDPASRRDMLTPRAIAFLSIMVVLAVVPFWRRPAFRPRIAAMTLAMLAFATIWTVAEVVAGTRGIQVPGPASGTYAPAPGGVAFAALAHDVVVEITLAYVPFLTVPILLGRVRTEPLS